jgi:hypothetical protein
MKLVISYGSTPIGQMDLAECDHEPSRLLLQRRADAPLKPKAAQEPTDFGPVRR